MAHRHGYATRVIYDELLFLRSGVRRPFKIRRGGDMWLCVALSNHHKYHKTADMVAKYVEGD